MKKPIGYILLFAVLSGFVGLQYIVLNRVLKKEQDLTEILGKIEKIEKVKILRRYVGYDDAISLKINSSPIRFVIRDNQVKAYLFLTNNYLINERIKLLYDSNGFNPDDGITFHVYALFVKNRNIMSIEESRKTDRFGLIVSFLADSFFIWMFIYAYRKRRMSITTKHNRLS